MTIVSTVGAMDVILRLDPRLLPETCVVSRGGWLCHGHGVNALVAAQATDLGEGTAFYDQRARIERA